MNYKEAKAKAIILTAARKLDHVIIENNGIYYVEMAKNWNGNYIELVKYEKENTEVVEPVKARGKKSVVAEKVEEEREEIQDIPEL